MFALFSFFSILSCSLSVFISPYKHTVYDLSVPYANQSNQQIKMTFVPDKDIPPYIYCIIDFGSTEIFLNNDAGSIKDCVLSTFYEFDGANFNAEADLIRNSSEKVINFVSSCGVYDTFFYFKLNNSLQVNAPHQLSFKLTSSLSQNDGGFMDYVSVYFISDLINIEKTFIYAYNDVFASYGIRDPLSNYPNLTLSRQRNFFSQDFSTKIIKVLDESLLSLAEAKIKLVDIGVFSFNEMILSSLLTGFATMDGTKYPSNIEQYPGFLGNFMLDMYLDSEIAAFTLFQITIPYGWKLENPACVSLNFTKKFDDGTTKQIDSIPHTKCETNNNLQTISFYNIMKLPSDTYIKMNITNIRNPTVPSSGMSEMMIYTENIKLMKYKCTELGLLQVIKTNNILITAKNTISDQLLTENGFILNKTQQTWLEIELLYFDILDESKLVITQNSSDPTKFGFQQGTCVIINDEYALKTVDSSPLECQMNKNDSTITISNISAFYSGYKLKIYFTNINEESENFIEYKAELFVKDAKTSDFVSSIENTAVVELSTTDLNIENAFYAYEDGTQEFNVFELPANQTTFNIQFTLPSGVQPTSSDTLSLIISQWIDVDTSDLSCSLDIDSQTKNVGCGYEKKTNIGVLTIQISSLNLFTNTSIVLKINGLYYNRIIFNAYKFVFDYYLIYSTDSKEYLNSISANISLQTTENPEVSQILILGQGNSSLTKFSVIRIKLGSPEFNYYTSLALSNYRIQVYFKNIATESFKNNGNCPFDSDITASCYVSLGVDSSSSNFYDWSSFQIYNITESYFENYIYFYFTPSSSTENPVFNIIYSLLSSTSKSYDYFYLTYARYLKESAEIVDLLNVTSLKIDWELSSYYNDESLYIRSERNLLFSIEMSLELFNSFYNSEKTGIFVFLLPWAQDKSIENTIECELLANPFSTVLSFTINDETNDKSILIISPDFSDLFSDTTNGFQDYMKCTSLTIPTMIKSPEYEALAINSEGVIIGKVSNEGNVYSLTAGY